MRYFAIANDNSCFWIAASNQDEALEIAILALKFEVDESAWISEHWYIELSPKCNYNHNVNISIEDFFVDKGSGYFIDKMKSYNKDYNVCRFKRFSVRNYYIDLAIKQIRKDEKNSSIIKLNY